MTRISYIQILIYLPPFVSHNAKARSAKHEFKDLVYLAATIALLIAMILLTSVFL